MRAMGGDVRGGVTASCGGHLAGQTGDRREGFPGGLTSQRRRDRRRQPEVAGTRRHGHVAHGRGEGQEIGVQDGTRRAGQDPCFGGSVLRRRAVGVQQADDQLRVVPVVPVPRPAGIPGRA